MLVFYIRAGLFDLVKIPYWLGLRVEHFTELILLVQTSLVSNFFPGEVGDRLGAITVVVLY